MLKGKQFFSWEMIPVAQAASSACGSDTALCASVTSLLVTLNRQADLDQQASDPPSYREISSLWQQADGVLSRFAGNAAVEGAVAALADDTSSLPGPSWLSPAMAVGALVGVLGLGYWWSRR